LAVQVSRVFTAGRRHPCAQIRGRLRAHRERDEELAPGSIPPAPIMTELDVSDHCAGVPMRSVLKA
jgi:hypothetical protein